MIRSRHIRRFWLWVGIGLLIELAVFTMWKRPYWFFPQGEASEYYTRYAGADGINAAFVKDYRINDTLRLDVTLLEVTDSAVWDPVCAELGLMTTAQLPEEYRDFYLAPGGFESYVLYDTLSVGGNPTPLQTVFIYSRYDRIICIFHHVSDAQYNAIMMRNIDEIDLGSENSESTLRKQFPE